MSYDMQAHRDAVRTHLIGLARSGAGWHAYVLVRAGNLEKGEPTLHQGLVAAVEAEIGPAAVKAARAAAKWMGAR